MLWSKRLKNSCLTKDSTKNSALIHYKTIINGKRSPRLMKWLLRAHYHPQPRISSSSHRTHPVFIFYRRYTSPTTPGRPIVSACSCPREKFYAYVDEVWLLLWKVYPPLLKTLTMHSTYLTPSDLIPLLQVITFSSPYGRQVTLHSNSKRLWTASASLLSR